VLNEYRNWETFWNQFSDQDKDPDSMGSGIRIWTQVDQHGTKRKKKEKISCFEELKILSEGLEVCPGAGDP
jgi:hypothetical protein